MNDLDALFGKSDKLIGLFPNCCRMTVRSGSWSID